MKKAYYLFVLLIGFQLHAINPNLKYGEIKGQIVDAKTKEAIPYVSIVIKDKNDKIITGGITDDNGKFKINKIPEGNYILEVQYMGFKTLNKPFSITFKNNKLDLGTINFEEDSQSLDAVEVRAEVSTTIQKVDRKVINIGKDLVSSGATVSEIMNNIPSVSVDQDGNISLRGNSNVRVLVDGKPSTVDAATLLKQIPSTSIKSVELITNPSAKYNPEGMSGMINIVLKKNSNLGFNGSINTGVTFGKKDPKYNASINMNYKTGKVNFYTNYGYNGGVWNNSGFVNRTEEQLNQDFSFISDNNSHLVKFGADIYINKKNTLSLFTNQSFLSNNGVNKIVIDDLINNTNDLIQSNDSKSKDKTQTYNIDYKLDFNKEGHHIEFEVNHNTSKPKEDAIFNKTPSLITDSDFNVLNYKDNIDNERNNTLFNIDYVNPLDSITKIELGFETRLRRTDNNRITTQDRLIVNNSGDFEDVPNSNFKYDQDILSVYGTYSKKFDKFTAQLGIRLENYIVNADFTTFNLDQSILENKKVDVDDINIYPSLFLTFKSSDKNQYQFSYSRRVDRPSLSQVNPIREWSTPRITSVGNPNLTPQFTNSIELNYTRQIKKGSITFGTFYRHIADNINRSIDIDPIDPTKLLLSHVNTDDNNAYGIELSSNYRIKKWWSVNASFDLYSQNQRGPISGEEVEITNISYNFRANNNFKTTKNLSFTLFGMYRGPNESLQFDVEEMYKIDIGARLKVLKGKASISARFNDIFDTMHFGFESDRPIPQIGRFFWESQTVYVGFNYRFGNGKNRAKSRKRRDNHEKRSGGGF